MHMPVVVPPHVPQVILPLQPKSRPAKPSTYDSTWNSDSTWKQIANSWPWEKEPSQANYKMEVDMVSDKEALSVDDNNFGQWNYLHQKWDDEKASNELAWSKWDDEKASNELAWSKWDDEKASNELAWSKWEDEKASNELAWSETWYRGGDNDTDEYEYIIEEHIDDVINRTKEVLRRHRGTAAYRSSKRGRSPQPSKRPRSRRAKARRNAKQQDKTKYSKVLLSELRYSQESCKETFQCGRKMSQLAQDLLDRKVRLSAPFMRLTVFETTDPKTKEPILRCIDNRRLYALKEYAKKKGKDRLMVNVELFDKYTLKQVQRFMQNSDNTDGRSVRLRKNTNKNSRNRGSSRSSRT